MNRLFKGPVIAGALWSSAALAGSLPANVKLVPGSADTIHDASGIAIGMTCEQASAIASKLAPPNWRLNHSAMQGTVRQKGERNGTDFEFINYEVPLKLYRGSIVTDMLKYSCLAGGTRAVFQIERNIRFGAYDAGSAPPIASLRAMFQEKYGVPTVEFSPLSFATLFNRAGSTSIQNSCGNYQNGHLYLNDFGTVDPDVCSYALTFVGQAAHGRPDTLGSVNITIRDYLRLQNDAEQESAGRANDAPVAMPKL